MNSAAYEDEEDFVDDGEHLLPILRYLFCCCNDEQEKRRTSLRGIESKLVGNL